QLPYQSPASQCRSRNGSCCLRMQPPSVSPGSIWMWCSHASTVVGLYSLPWPVSLSAPSCCRTCRTVLTQQLRPLSTPLIIIVLLLTSLILIDAEPIQNRMLLLFGFYT